MHIFFKPVLYLQIVVPLHCSHYCQTQTGGPFPAPALVETVEDVPGIERLLSRIGNSEYTSGYRDTYSSAGRRIYIKAFLSRLPIRVLASDSFILTTKAS